MILDRVNSLGEIFALDPQLFYALPLWATVISASSVTFKFEYDRSVASVTASVPSTRPACSRSSVSRSVNHNVLDICRVTSDIQPATEQIRDQWQDRPACFYPDSSCIVSQHQTTSRRRCSAGHSHANFLAGRSLRQCFNVSIDLATYSSSLQDPTLFYESSCQRQRRCPLPSMKVSVWERHDNSLCYLLPMSLMKQH
jgi:hypothetical protein